MEEKNSRKDFTFLILEGAGAKMHTDLRAKQWLLTQQT